MTRLIAWVRELTMWPMLVKEFIQLSRDRPTIAMMVGVPAIQLMLFGFAIRTEVRNLPTAVYDEAKSSDSRALVQTILNTGNFRFYADATSRDEVTAWIESGKVAAAIVIPPDFTRDLARHHTAKVQVIVDAADPLASQAAMSGAAMGGQQRALDIVTARGGGGVPLEVVGKMLGHKNYRTTQRYAHIADSALRDAVNLTSKTIVRAGKGKSKKGPQARSLR